MRHISKIPCTVPVHAPSRLLLICLIVNGLFVGMHIVCAHPAVQSHFGYPLDCVNLNVEANLPTNWAILQLYFAAIVCTLMIFWHAPGDCPVFWKVGAVVLFYFGFDESAQLHELWSAGLFPLLVGAKGFMSGNRPTLLIYGLLLGGFYLSALIAFAKGSPRALTLLVLSGVALVLSQAAEIALPGALQLHHAFVGYLQELLPEVSGRNLQFVWEEGLEMVCYSLIVAGVLRGAWDAQNASCSSKKEQSTGNGVSACSLAATKPGSTDAGR